MIKLNRICCHRCCMSCIALYQTSHFVKWQKFKFDPSLVRPVDSQKLCMQCTPFELKIVIMSPMFFLCLRDVVVHISFLCLVSSMCAILRFFSPFASHAKLQMYIINNCTTINRCARQQRQRERRRWRRATFEIWYNWENNNAHRETNTAVTKP